MSLGHNAVGHLRRVVDRVEAIEEEIKVLNKEKSEVYKQAKNTGLVPKAIKNVISARREKPEDRKEATQLFDTYFSSLESDETSARPEADAEAGEVADDVPPPASTPTPEPEPAEPLHEPGAAQQQNFGSPDLDGTDHPEQEVSDGKEEKPKINMEFPDGAVPDEFGEKYD